MGCITSCIFSPSSKQQTPSNRVKGLETEFVDDQKSINWLDMVECDMSVMINPDKVERDTSGSLLYRASPYDLSESCVDVPEPWVDNMSMHSNQSRIIEPIQIVNSNWLSTIAGDMNHGQVSIGPSEMTYARLPSETKTDVSYMQKTNESSYLVSPGNIKDVSSLLATIKKKPTHRSMKRSRISSQRNFCSDSEHELTWSENTADDQPQCYVLRHSRKFFYQSSPRSVMKSQNAKDDGTHSPPSVMISPQFGWNELPLRTSTILPTPSGSCFPSGSIRLNPQCVAQHNHFPKCIPHFKGQTTDQRFPLLSEDYKTSPHVTEGSADDAASVKKYNQTRSQSAANQPSQEGKDSVRVDMEYSVRIKGQDEDLPYSHMTNRY